MKLSSFQKALFLLFLGVVFFYSFNPLNESDNFYHIKAGELIWQTKSIPQSDVFSLTAQGAPWVTHEWLAELIFYTLSQLAGLWGVVIFVALLAMLTYYLVVKTALMKGANFYLTILLAFLFAYFTFTVWTPRPQVFAFAFFALLIYLLERYRLQARPWIFRTLIILMWAWANINASFLLGVGVLFIYAVFQWTRIELSKKERQSLLFAAIAATLICLVNPNGYKVFTYILSVRPVTTLLAIYEWKPIYAFLSELSTKVLIFELVFFGGVLIWWHGFRKQSHDFIWLLLILATFLLPFISIRHIGFWPIVAIPAAAVAASTLAARPLTIFSIERLNSILLILLLIFFGVRLMNVSYSPVNRQTIPVDAVNFIQQNDLHGPFFNLYNEGGYLLSRLWPKEKVFIDGRSEVYIGRPVNEFLEVVHADSESEWQQFVDEKYHLNYFILSYRPNSLANSIRKLIYTLLTRNWVLVYWDDTSIIFVRNVPENNAIIARYGLRHVNPFRDPNSIPADEGKISLAELRDLLDRSTQTQVIYQYAHMLTKHLNITL